MAQLSWWDRFLGLPSHWDDKLKKELMDEYEEEKEARMAIRPRLSIGESVVTTASADTTFTMTYNHLLPSGEQITVTNEAPDTNRIFTSCGTQHVVDDQSLKAILNGNMTISNPISDEEKQELEDIRKERDSWIRRQKLKSFQKMPAHLRQAIVDEAYVRDFVNQMANVNIEEFDNKERLAELEVREQQGNMSFILGTPQSSGHWFSNATVNIDSGTDHYYPENRMNFKYGTIINEFTTEELADAHSAATLEESL